MPVTNPIQMENLRRSSADTSFIITHLVREVGTNGRSIRSCEQACAILKSILDFEHRGECPVLRASSIEHDLGYPSYTDSKGVPKAVSLTEATLLGLKAHRDVFDVHYGVSFRQSYILEKKGNPCILINSEVLSSIVNDIPWSIRPFVREIKNKEGHLYYGGNEREWRIAEDLHFDLNYLQFIFCQSEDFSFFSSLQKFGFPVLFDLKWLDLV